MVLGADTGFLLLLGEKHPRCLELWNEMQQGEHILFLSTLSIAEYLAYNIMRGTLTPAENFVQALQSVESIRIVPVSQAVAAQSARYRIGMSLPTVDSIIFTTVVLEGCTLFLTSDSVFDQESIRNLIPVELLT